MLWYTQNLVFLYYFMVLVICEPSPTSEFPAPTPSTIVDILSSQVEYSYFLRHLQRNGMIPILNSLSNVTLLAPVNLAFTSGSDKDVDKELPHDNNMLLRYVINQRFRVGYLGTDKIIYNTLYDVEGSSYLVVISPDIEHAEYIVDDIAAIVEVDIYAKHQDSFVQGVDSLLPLKPTFCEVLFSDDDISLGPHLVSFMKQLFRQLFEEHGTITDSDSDNYVTVTGNERNSLIKLPLSCKEFMSRTKTLLMLSDAYISESLPDITRQYLTSLAKSSNGKKYSMTKEAVLEVKNDIVNFLESLMINHLIGGVNGTSRDYLSINGRSEFNFSLKKFTGQLLLNDKISSSTNASNLAFSDAMLHVFDVQNQTSHGFFEDLNVPLVKIQPRKALYAMQYSNFVKEVNFRSLHHLIDGSTSNQTILVESSQRDQVHGDDFSSSGYDGSHFSYKQIMYYQFSDQMIDIENVRQDLTYENFYTLLDSKLCSKNKIGSCYKTKLSASYNTDLKKIEATINDDINIMLPGMKAENNNVIYVTKEEINPPLTLKQSLLRLLSNGGVSRHLENFEIDRRSFLSTLRYLEQFDLLSLTENKKGYSIFLPCGYVEEEKGEDLLSKKRKISEPWKSMGLILNFLESNPKYFQDLLKGLFVENTIYSDFGIYDHLNQTVSTNLRGDSVNIAHSYVDENYNHFISLNNTELSVPLNSDILFNQGVIHIINEVLLPESFRISFSDLIKTTENPNYPGFSFLDLIGTYPKLCEVLGISNENINPKYSLLIPSPDSLKNFNITSEFTKLWDFLEFHLIPNTELSPLISCVNGLIPTNGSLDPINFEYNIKTNLSDTVLGCRKDTFTGKTFLRLRPTDTSSGNPSFNSMSYNKDREVQILSHGCTSMHNNSILDGACVFLIDKPLNLKWLEDPDKNTFLHIHIGFISVGVGIILGLLLFGLVIFGVFVFISRSRLDQPLPSLSPAPNDSIYGDHEPNYMRIQTGENDNVYDQGYETDDDFLLAEGDHLLPLHGKRSRRAKYGSVNNNEVAATAPLSIKGNHIGKALNRERNLPGGF